MLSPWVCSDLDLSSSLTSGLFLLSTTPTKLPLLDASQVRHWSCTPPLSREEYFEMLLIRRELFFFGKFKFLSAFVTVFEAIGASRSFVLAKDHKLLACSAKRQKMF